MEEETNEKSNIIDKGKVEAGTVINSISTLPSILGAANKGKKEESDMQGKLENSYAGVLKGNRHKGKIDVRYMPGEIGNEDDPVIIPIENLKSASIPFVNTLYGYMIDKKLAFPVIQKEVRRLWKNVGLEEVFMNNKGFFFFKFSDEQGMLSVLEESPWLMFNNMPLFLQRWRPGLTLTKNSHDKIPVWVKIYDLPLEVWSGDNLCIIASKLGIPLAFDSFTEEMCLEHKGRNAYARILIEMSAGKEWKKSIDVSTWDFVTNSAVIQRFEVEYAWVPSRCSHCKVYGHMDKICMASMKGSNSAQNGNNGINKEDKGKSVIDNEGYIEVVNKRNKNVKDGEGTSKTLMNSVNNVNQKYNGRNNISRAGNKFRGQNWNRGGNGRGQNGYVNNKGVSHWNMEKNKRYEKVSGQYDNNDRSYKGGIKQGVSEKNVIEKEENKKMVKKADNSNVNSFEILGVFDEEVIIGMEEDDRGDKNGVISENQTCVQTTFDDSGLNNDLIHSMGIRKEDLELVNNENKIDSIRDNKSSSKGEFSQAFEVVNVKNNVVIQ